MRAPDGLLRRMVEVVARENSTPLRLGAGVALGAFIGMTPLYGFHLALALALAALLRVNLAGAALATQISNPFLAPFLIFMSIRLGSWMGMGAPAAGAGGPGLLRAWAAGGLALGAVTGVALGALAGGWRALWLARRRGQDGKGAGGANERTV